jgi:hypothetical protein
MKSDGNYDITIDMDISIGLQRKLSVVIRTYYCNLSLSHQTCHEMAVAMHQRGGNENVLAVARFMHIGHE